MAQILLYKTNKPGSSLWKLVRNEPLKDLIELSSITYTSDTIIA